MIFTILNLILTAICLLGTWANTKQLRVGFVLWIFTNTVYMLMDIFMYKNYGRALLFAVQTGMCVIGIWNWKKIEEKLICNECIRCKRKLAKNDEK